MIEAVAGARLVRAFLEGRDARSLVVFCVAWGLFFLFPAVLVFTWRHSLSVSDGGVVTERYSTLVSRRSRELSGRLRDARVIFAKERYRLDVITSGEVAIFSSYTPREAAERDAARLRAAVSPDDGSESAVRPPDAATM